MRLINTKTLVLEEYFNNIPPYAILSHTWGDGEVSFADWKDLDAARLKEGFRKIELTCKQAAEDGYEWAWVDTNCIDKTSSSELSEAINSMFVWYRDAQVCYVFLKDVTVGEPAEDAGDGSSGTGTGTAGGQRPQKYLANPDVRRAFKASVWFTRGWTLQELLAPSKVIFFSREWLQLATKEGERRLISDITDIDSDYIKRSEHIYTASVARRMSWMARRKTTRVEDTAYCLLGLFGIHMALLYGEGHRAFLRLQEEIIRVSNDQTIFCWQANMGRAFGNKGARHLFEDAELFGGVAGHDAHRQAELEQWTSILAPHPSVFRDSALYSSEFGSADRAAAAANSTAVGPYSITNFGLSISLPLLYTAKGACAVLDVGYRRTSNDRASRVVVPLHRVQSGHYIRLSTQLLVMMIPAALTDTRAQIFVDCRNAQSHGAALLLNQRISARPVNMGDVDKHPVMFLAFNRPVDIDRTPLVATDMDFVPFHSAIEVNNHRLGTQSAAILTGKAAAGAEPFHLLIGGRSNPATAATAEGGGGGGIGSGSGSDAAALLRKKQQHIPSFDDDRPELSMDWHADLWDRPPPDPARWNEVALKPLIDRLSAEYFGSWCTSRALRNVLSWRYSSDGALVCYFELDELYASPGPGAGAGAPGQLENPSRSAPSLATTTALDDDEEHLRFSALRRSNSDTSSMQQLYSMLQGQHQTKLRQAQTFRSSSNRF